MLSHAFPLPWWGNEVFLEDCKILYHIYSTVSKNLMKVNIANDFYKRIGTPKILFLGPPMRLVPSLSTHCAASETVADIVIEHIKANLHPFPHHQNTSHTDIPIPVTCPLPSPSSHFVCCTKLPLVILKWSCHDRLMIRVASNAAIASNKHFSLLWHGVYTPMKLNDEW